MNETTDTEPGSGVQARLMIVLIKAVSQGSLPDRERQWIEKLLDLYPEWSQAESLRETLRDFASLR